VKVTVSSADMKLVGQLDAICILRRGSEAIGPSGASVIAAELTRAGIQASPAGRFARNVPGPPQKQP
jgi:hypothetical protein